MSIQGIKTLAYISPILSRGGWTEADIHTLSNSASAVGGGEFNAELIYADLAANDALWRILSLLDPFRVTDDPRYHFVKSFAALRRLLSERYELPPDEADDIAKPIAGFLTDLTSRIRGRSRAMIDSGVRAQLAELSSPVRCWYCGAHFPQPVVEAFVTRKQKIGNLPPYIDFMTHRGIIARDMQIEIDHIVPIASGGSNDVSNLRISCGWCNKHKRELKSLYDASSMPSVYQHPRSGTWLIPAPYWVIRILGTRRRCEWPSGCRVKVEKEPLYVAPRNPDGSMTPGNIGVFCQQHDPLVRERLVPNTALTG